MLAQYDAFWMFMAVIASGGIAIIGYDVYRALTGQPTISEQTMELSKHTPIIAWGFGVVAGLLAGHFWWQM